MSTDTDGSYQTMEIVRSGGDDYEFVVRDDFATACSGAPATLTGTGLLETGERLVIAQPELTCDDGTIPVSGPRPRRSPPTSPLNSTGEGSVTPAKELWDPVNTPPIDEDGNSEAHNRPFDLVETGLGAFFKGASTEIPEEATPIVESLEFHTG